MKPIKFDLKLNNGTITLATLDDLEENLSPELFTHFHSGKLAKWLKVRKLDELAEKVDTLRAQHLADKNELDVKLFKNLCEIFVSQVSEDDAREAMQDYQPTKFEQDSNNDDEVEQLKSQLDLKNQEIETLKIEFDLLKNPPKPKEKIVENFIIHDNGTVTDTKTGLTWLRFSYGEFWANDSIIGTAIQITWDAAMKVPFAFNKKGYADYNDWRVPNIKELETLIDTERGAEEYWMNAEVFPRSDCYRPWFWSCTTHDKDKGDALGVGVANTYSNRNAKKFDCYLRLVRG